MSLQTPDSPGHGLSPGSPCLDAPIRDAHGRDGWLLDHLGGSFTLLVLAATPLDHAAIAALRPQVRILTVADGTSQASDSQTIVDAQGLVNERYDLRPGMACLIRPDAHVAARFADASASLVASALARACGAGLRLVREAA
jgi:3-(3-hydroxy-phenyl)propionate hydroxylase